MKHYVLLLLLLVSFPVSRCHANLSGPWKGGQLLLDVEGVKDIAIVRETLRIDLRPLEQRGMIQITATYVIDHPLPPKSLPLTFITGVQSVSGIKCSLNGTPLAFTTRQVVDMPVSWKPPNQTPGFVPDERLLYSRSVTDTQHQWILFTVPLQTGRQNIEVTYEVEAGEYYAERYTAKFWQTAYILAPARTWKSFGGLDLEVLAPDNWQVKSNLALVNQGQRWTASFDALPADYLALTTQHPKSKWVPLIGLMESFCLFGTVTLLLGLRQMRSQYRHVKQNMKVVDQSRQYRNEGLLFLLCYLLPLAWNSVVIIAAKHDLPDSQNNYQMFVIFVMIQGVYWLIIIAPLMMLSRPIFELFSLVGTWLGRRAKAKLNAGVEKTVC